MGVGKFWVVSVKFSLSYLPAASRKGPMKAFKAFIKPFYGTRKKYKNKNLRQLSLAVWGRNRKEGLIIQIKMLKQRKTVKFKFRYNLDFCCKT